MVWPLSVAIPKNKVHSVHITRNVTFADSICKLNGNETTANGMEQRVHPVPGVPLIDSVMYEPTYRTMRLIHVSLPSYIGSRTV